MFLFKSNTIFSSNGWKNMCVHRTHVYQFPNYEMDAGEMNVIALEKNSIST